MTEPRTTSRISTQGRTSGKIVTELSSIGRSTPRSFSTHAWRRFAADRRRRYVSRIIAGPPTDAQAAQIQSMIRVEWSALRAEAEGSLLADRHALDARRLLWRVQADFERTLPKAPQPASRAPSLAEIVAEATARRRGDAA
jgi:hypothetical protein